MAARKKGPGKRSSEKAPVTNVSGPKRTKALSGPSKRPGAEKDIKKKPVKKAVTKTSGLSRPLFIVGIGASAGGLEALEGFFSKLPSDSSMSFIIIQHLAPGRKSIMANLLTKHTDMRIFEIEDGMKVEPNCVYMNQPDKDVSIMNGTLYLTVPLESHAVRLPIDYFFRSLALDQREKAICIILSGTGSDGTLGLKAVKGEGGTTMVQEEAQAKYNSMPRSAINTGLVDFILPVEQMAGELIQYIQHPYMENARKTITLKQEYMNAIKKIFLLIRTTTGHDFSSYKQNTTRRRIERRMAVHQISHISDYLRYLRENPQEVKTLFKDMLIGVTNFFRDPEAFDALNEKVISTFIEGKGPESDLRVWVPGCATGEEAYSLAILFQECMDRLNKHLNVQIFATDLDADAVEFARAGVYPESIAADVSAGRLKQFFTRVDNNYVIKKQIRELVVFAVQNLIKDPPFSRLDMVSCRNLLIYMDSALQKKILPLFHYTLLNDGVLFLGTSESIGEFADYFMPVSTRWKIFRRKGILPERALEYHVTPFYAADLQRAEGKKLLSETNIRQLAESVILHDFAPACVLINEKFDIIYFHGNTERYLSPPVGEASFNVLKMARGDLRYKLSTLLYEAVKQKKQVISEGLHIKQDGHLKTFDLIIRPLAGELAVPGMLMVLFKETAPAERSSEKSKRKTVRTTAPDPNITRLEQELQSTKEYLQTTIEELETSNEELKSTNEELQSTNEELQSTNEEMETSREELQSTNEELETVNSELQSKLEDLSRANNDLNNLLASTDIGTIFLDSELNISRFTPSMTRIFNLIQTDIGRPISHITSKTGYQDITGDSRRVLDTLVMKEIEIQTNDGGWFNMRILPYRTVDNVIDGVVITFADITKIKKAEKAQLLAAVVSDSNDAIILLDPDGRITAWNRGAGKMYGYTEAEALTMNISGLVPEDKRNEVLGMLSQFRNSERLGSMETRRLAKDGRVLDVWLTVTRLVDDKGNVTAISTTERDITELHGMKDE